MTRVVHVSDCYPPRVGGIESQVRDLAVRQARQGMDVHVLTATLGESPDRDTDGGPTVHRIATPLTLGVPVHPLERPLLRRALAGLRPDVVHVHAGVVSPFAYDGAAVARALGLPLVITWHCMLDGMVTPYRLGARLTGWHDAPAVFTAVSAVAGQRVSDVLGGHDIAVVPNGLDVAAWSGGSAAPLPPAGPLRVVATQRLAPRKRPVPLVRVVAEAHDRLGTDDAGRPRVHLTLVGAGPAARGVRAEIDRLGLAGVVDLAGRVPRDALHRLYRDEHVFVAPARLEAFGIAALEARAAGLAVVAGRGTGVSEFVTDGVDGLLTPDGAAGPDDAGADAALADALMRLAEDPVLLGRILEHNRTVAPAADWSDVLDRSAAAYARAREQRAVRR